MKSVACQKQVEEKQNIRDRWIRYFANCGLDPESTMYACKT